MSRSSPIRIAVIADTHSLFDPTLHMLFRLIVRCHTFN